MAPLPSFLLTGGINEVLGDIVADELRQTVSTRAVITLQSNWPSDVPLVWEGEINWLKQPVIARIDDSGNLVNEDGDPLRLLARHPELVENLQWRISVDLPPTVLPPKPGGRLRTWTIDAGEDNATVDLGEAVPMATVKGITTLRGPAGPVGVDDVVSTDSGTAIQFKRGGQNVGAAIPVPLTQTAISSALSSINVPARRTNFRTKADTASPATVEDTGQTVAYQLNGATAAISGGAFTLTPTTYPAAVYRYFGGGATRLGCRVMFDAAGKTTYNGSVCLSILNEPMGSATPALRIGAHLVITPFNATFQKYNNTTQTFTTLKLVDFATPLFAGVEHAVDMFHDEGSSTVFVVLPDGSRFSVTDPDIALWATTFGFVEVYQQAATDVVPRVVEVWSDASVQVGAALADAVDGYVEANVGLIAVDDVVPANGGTAIQFRRQNQPVGEIDISDYIFSGLSIDGQPVSGYDLDTTPPTASDVGAYTAAQVDAAIAAAIASPQISLIKDSNNNTVFRMTGVTSAVNYARVYNSATGAFPYIEPTGTDTNISFGLLPKGNGKFLIYVPAGQTPTIQGTGPDANHNFNLTTKGAGVVQANGVEVATISGTQTLTGKTLTDPKINAIKDGNGVTSLNISTIANAVNYLSFVNAATGSAPNFTAVGADSNIDISFTPKGSAPTLSMWASAAAAGRLVVSGSSSVVGWNIVTKGGGTVQANGNPVGVKVATPASATATGTPGQWAVDSGFAYFCTATNTWVRAAVATW